LVDGIAQIWWRQHEQYRNVNGEKLKGDDQGTGDEIGGFELMEVFSNYGVLQELMFSTVMLHWNMYAPLPPSQRLTCERWQALNQREVGVEGNELTQNALRMIYSCVGRSFIPRLQIWPASASSEKVKRGSGGGGGSKEAAVAGSSAPFRPPDPSVESWAKLPGRAFPAPAGTSGTITYRNIRNILSETSRNATLMVTPVNSRQDSVDFKGSPAMDAPMSVAYRFPTHSVEAAPFGACIEDEEMEQDRVVGSQRITKSDPAVGGQPLDHVWLTLFGPLLLFAPKPRDWAPYAFFHLCQSVAYRVEDKLLTITFTGTLKAAGSTTRNPRRTSGSDPATSSEPVLSPLEIIFLLPDGRWQVLAVPKLQVQLPDEQQFKLWMSEVS
jgi:hypothetical protein